MSALLKVRATQRDGSTSTPSGNHTFYADSKGVIPTLPEDNFKTWLFKSWGIPAGRGPWFKYVMAVRERKGTGDEFDTNRPWEDQVSEQFNAANGPVYSMRHRGKRSGDYVYTAPGIEPLVIGKWCYLTDKEIEPYKGLKVFAYDDKWRNDCPYLGMRLGWLTFESSLHQGDIFKMMCRISRGRYIDTAHGGGWWLVNDKGNEPTFQFIYTVDVSMSQARQLVSAKIKYGDTYHALEFIVPVLYEYALIFGFLFEDSVLSFLQP